MMEMVEVNMTCLVLIVLEMEVDRRSEVLVEVEDSQQIEMVVLLILEQLLLNVHDLCRQCYQ